MTFSLSGLLTRFVFFMFQIFLRHYHDKITLYNILLFCLFFRALNIMSSMKIVEVCHHYFIWIAVSYERKIAK